MTQHPREITRDEQIENALRVMREAREQGWGKVSIEVTRGGTLKVDAEAGEGAKVTRPQFGTGLKR